MTTLAALYRSTRTRLTEVGIASAALDARLIIEHVTGSKPEDIVCRPMQEISEADVRAADAAVARRIAGEPVHRIRGSREFYSLSYKLSPETLEPRPDTETLVHAVLPFAQERVQATGACRVLDLGTGTGVLGLSLVVQAQGATAVATDISEGALATARENAARYHLSDRFSTLQSNWFESVSGRFDLIVSNPPYIRSEVIPTLDASVRDHDPLAALDGGVDGLDAYRSIAAGASAHIAGDGLIAVEIGFDQAESVGALFREQDFQVDEVRRDLAGNDRVLLMKMRQ